MNIVTTDNKYTLFAGSDAPSHVYFIRAGKTPFVKIGYTDNPRKRLVMLQVAHYERLRIEQCVGFATRQQAERVERRLHEMHSKDAVRGEWFLLTVSQVTHDVLRLRQSMAMLKVNQV